MDAVISFSRLQAFQRCPWLYHLVYNEGWRSGPTGSAALGQSLHQALAAYHSESNSEKSLTRLWEFFDNVWVNEGFGSPQAVFQKYDEGRRMLEQFWKIDQSRSSQVVGVEKIFKFDLDGIQVQGTMDRLDRAADGVHEIIEYKTRGEHWTPERIRNDLQMTFYQWGAERALGVKPVRLIYYFLSTGTSVVTERAQEDLDQLDSLVKSLAGKIRQQEFSPNPSYCSRCEMGRRCVHFKGDSKPC